MGDPPSNGEGLQARGSFEIVQKALTASVPIVARISAPSSLAVQLAWESGFIDFLLDLAHPFGGSTTHDVERAFDAAVFVDSETEAERRFKKWEVYIEALRPKVSQFFFDKQVDQPN